jgi:hypothetical protein
MAQIATAIFVVGIFGLFVLDRDREARTSKALWLPVMWLLIAGSRPVSVWLQFRPASTPAQYLEGSPIDRSIYLVLLIAGLIVLVGRQRTVWPIFKRNWPLVIFVLYCAMSISWSDYPDVAFKRWIKSLGDYVMVLIVLTDGDPERALKEVLAKPGYLLLPISVLLIKYYPDLGRSYPAHWEGTAYYVGVAEDKNMLGMACLVFGLASFWRFLQSFRVSHRTRTLIVHGTITAMTLWLFWMANSMTSLWCFLMASGLIAATSFSKIAQKRGVVHLMVPALLLICFSVLFLDVGGFLLKEMGRNPTLTGRSEIWGQLLKVPVNPVFGVGFESFWLGKRLEYVWSLPGLHINEAHSGSLETYLNLGWIGLTLLAVVVVIGYRNVIRMLSSDFEAGQLRLAFFVVGLAYSLTESAFRTMDLVWIAFLFAIIGLPQTPTVNTVASRIGGTKALVTSENLRRGSSRDCLRSN